jgi:hypothetical protein
MNSHIQCLTSFVLPTVMDLQDMELQVGNGLVVDVLQKVG